MSTNTDWYRSPYFSDRVPELTMAQRRKAEAFTEQYFPPRPQYSKAVKRLIRKYSNKVVGKAGRRKTTRYPAWRVNLATFQLLR